MRVSFFATLALFALFAFFAANSSAQVEKWADPNLPVKDGVWLWLDATRQIPAWESHEKGLIAGQTMDVVYDASGNHRDFTQPIRDAQPKFLSNQNLAAIRFDGKDDHLRFAGPESKLETFTAFVVANPHTNTGGFRAMLSAFDTGKNDYVTGFNIDFGPNASDGFGIAMLNTEGPGFVGVKSLLKGPLIYEDFYCIAITYSSGPDGIVGYVNGEQTGKRDRSPGRLRTTNLLLGARCFSNEDVPPYLQGFLDGDIAEVLVYDRVVSADERVAIEKHLREKHEGASEVLNRPIDAGHVLKPVENVPEVQVFVPGFEARKLPVDLTNINNIRYRDDGKLVAVAYDGRIYILSDTNGDGLEDKADLFFDGREKLISPIGIALTPPGYPQGRGVFVPCKGKLALIVDTDNDEKADKEITVATGWKGTFHSVDTLGVALDKDNNVYFGLGTSNFADPYLRDEQKVSHYDLKSERGTVVKVSPDFSKREIVCTGIRFPVGMAFNPLGDLFVTDQEGATWCPNGNPFDELLHIQQGRHYGFPPRHPKMLPDVIDEPSDFDYGPQHQSTCGLVFNPQTGASIGPESWRADALVTGESRGKLYRTKLAKTGAGYVAQNHLWASIPMLAIDNCVSPTGDLVVACHSGNPDWGTGPTGKGTLYKISYREKSIPQPSLAYPAGPGEVRIAFDRPVDPELLKQWSSKVAIDYGRYVAAGDRFETIRPGYAAVKRQMRYPREALQVTSVQLTPDHRTVVLSTAPQREALPHAITTPSFGRKPDALPQTDEIDLAYDLSGVSAEWKSQDGKTSWTGWLPHPDLSVSRAFTQGSAEHDAFWKLLRAPGTLTMRTSLDLHDMLRPAVQPGSEVDFTLPPEQVTVAFRSSSAARIVAKGQATADGTFTVTPEKGQLVPVEVTLATGSSDATLSVTFTTQESSTPRPLALRRFIVPWARLPTDSTDASIAIAEPIPQLAGGDWLRGRALFFGNEAGCAKCHTVRGRGADLAPDLSNLIHRDYESVMRDIANPSGALNPDYIGSIVKLKDGRVLSGIVRNTDAEHFIVRGDADGEKAPIARADVKRISASPISVMPTNLPEGLGAEKMRDLLTFLLTEPITPAPIERKGEPPPRSRAEVDVVLKSVATTKPSDKPLNILLVAGAKDHGPSEHDYPLWQKRWTTLLGLAENVKVDQATDWPTPAQWQTADTVAFFCANAAWDESKAKDLDAHLARGKGLIFLHFAVNGQKAPEALADRIGLAWGGGVPKFRHGALDLTFRDTFHPITRGFEKIHFIDETYWDLTGDVKNIHLLADAPELGKPVPMLWTREQGKGRVFVSILGHYSWTFDDPLFRILLLRAFCWTAGDEVDRLTPLATIGARVRQTP